MKKIDLGQTIQILANVGVIAGIAFLAFELRQNNELMRAEARYNLLQNRTPFHMMVVENPDVAQFLIDVRNAEELSDVEKEQLYWYFDLMLASWDYDYQQYAQGLVDEESLPVYGWMRMFDQNRRLVEFWRENKDGYSEGFKRFMDERVFRNSIE